MWPNHIKKTSFIISQPKQCKQNENPITDKVTKQKLNFAFATWQKGSRKVIATTANYSLL